ncbi:MFS transporter [Streptomyces litchfieldiae]|uniref:MFS transporter n=1 Tax=Streptomyces litchfieldiae TaxID=3075543 RepID=A0ABU2MNE7_9ACTN|nr:MFS transporter [Streptomyces sp. DSM 44938]MDT0343136.1 MFS transporter [Streptomyces sp. DSM 44938]
MPDTSLAHTRVPAAVLAVAAATFCVVTSEMLPVGLLTPVADGLGVSDGLAGLAVTVPGLVAALAAPLLPPAARRTDRRTVLVALMVLLAAANVLSALAPALPVLLAARVLVGVCIGGVWAIAAGLAADLVPRERVGRSTALIFSGIAVASVLGVPAGTFMGELAGWRASFGAAGALALVVAGALARTLPPLPPREPVRLRALTALLRTPAVVTGLLVISLLVTGHFAAYTYIRPVLERADGLGASAIGALLLVYGAAGIAGNFLGGTAAARDPRRTLLAITTVLAATVLLLEPTAAAPLVVVWGLAYGGVSVTMQNWMMAAAPHAREAASALFAGVFNAAIGTGAFLGGRAAELSGTGAPLWLGGALAAAALLPVLATRRDPA